MNMILASGMEVFTTILYVILAIAVLLLMVLIHEFGHYVVGRMLGFKITEFSVGFGKAIFQRKNKRGELISLRIFPLGELSEWLKFCASSITRMKGLLSSPVFTLKFQISHNINSVNRT